MNLAGMNYIVATSVSDEGPMPRSICSFDDKINRHLCNLFTGFVKISRKHKNDFSICLKNYSFCTI